MTLSRILLLACALVACTAPNRDDDGDSNACPDVRQCANGVCCEPGTKCGPDGATCVACTPTACERDACGPTSDGCGGGQDCGACLEPESCGGGGTLGKCGMPDSRRPSATCERWLACAAVVSPQTFPQAQAVYGAQGSCWASSQGAESCGAACATSLDDARRQSPNEAACLKCASDRDCPTAKPSCDRSSGTCVGCLADADCANSASGKACDVATHTCVPCTSDAQCRSGVDTVCDTTAHRCVGCTSDAQCSGWRAHCSAGKCVECNTNPQCSSGKCEADHTCCKPKTCQPGMCGDQPDGCGRTLRCGTCALGTCENNTCNTEGQPCTPCSTNCGQWRDCAFEATKKAYFCSSRHSSEGQACYNDGDCDNYSSANYEFCDYIFHSVNNRGGCTRWCTSSCECGAGHTCKVISTGKPLSKDSPGACD